MQNLIKIVILGMILTYNGFCVIVTLTIGRLLCFIKLFLITKTAPRISYTVMFNFNRLTQAFSMFNTNCKQALIKEMKNLYVGKEIKTQLETIAVCFDVMAEVNIFCCNQAGVLCIENSKQQFYRNASYDCDPQNFNTIAWHLVFSIELARHVRIGYKHTITSLQILQLTGCVRFRLDVVLVIAVVTSVS